MVTRLTGRNIPEELAPALEAKKLQGGGSLNKTVIDLLRQSLELDGRKTNGLARLAGTWTHCEEEEFLQNTAAFGQTDPISGAEQLLS